MTQYINIWLADSVCIDPVTGLLNQNAAFLSLPLLVNFQLDTPYSKVNDVKLYADNLYHALYEYRQ